VVKRAFGPKGKEETGGLVNMHDENLHDLQSSSSIIRMIEAGMMGWEGNLSRLLGDIYRYIYTYKCGVLVGISEGKGRL
jgi:hypothetical protein